MYTVQRVRESGAYLHMWPLWPCPHLVGQFTDQLIILQVNLQANLPLSRSIHHLAGQFQKLATPKFDSRYAPAESVFGCLRDKDSDELV